MLCLGNPNPSQLYVAAQTPHGNVVFLNVKENSKVVGQMYLFLNLLPHKSQL
jgi:hypothetical protein